MLLVKPEIFVLGPQIYNFLACAYNNTLNYYLQTSKPVMSEEGKSLGLIDAIASPEELLEVACDLALDIVESRRPRLSSLSRTDKLGSTEQAMEILEGIRQGAKETAHTMPEKLACLDVIGEGITSGGRSGVLKVVQNNFQHAFVNE